MKFRPLPPHERLAELFRYDHETGELIRRLPVYCGKNYRLEKYKTGEVVGSKMLCGYLSCQIDGASYYVHRIIWKLVYGEDPEDEIDHINGNREDNRLSNLVQRSNSLTT